MNLNELLSDLRYVASQRRALARTIDDGAALIELGWAESDTRHPWYLVVTPEGLDVLHACRDVVLEAA